MAMKSREVRSLSEDGRHQDRQKHLSEKSGNEDPFHLGSPRSRAALPWKLSCGSITDIKVCTVNPCTPRNFYCMDSTIVKKK